MLTSRYLTLPLSYLTHTLAFENDEETDDFLKAHHAAIYTNAVQPRDPANPWKPVAPVPLSKRIWDCKKAHPACARGVDKYRVVDLKGQVD